MSAATLKRYDRCGASDDVAAAFPRSRERGHIEATCELGVSALIADAFPRSRERGHIEAEAMPNIVRAVNGRVSALT